MKTTLLILGSILLNVVFTLGIINLLKPKIAYVRSSHILKEFKGAQEGEAMFKDKISPIQTKVDSLQLIYQNYIDLYSPGRIEELKHNREFHQVAKSLQYFNEKVKTESKKYEEKYTQGVLNQLNARIELYGTSAEYDMILGTTENGNILYASDAIDITEELIESINADF